MDYRSRGQSICTCIVQKGNRGRRRIGMHGELSMVN